MGKKAYHHGNLREALVAAARDILDTRGVEGLSLRKVAQQTGVSPTALYSHFQDKRELLAMLAIEGFESLTARMEQEAMQNSSPTAGSLSLIHISEPTRLLVQSRLPSSA